MKPLCHRRHREHRDYVNYFFSSFLVCVLAIIFFTQGCSLPNFAKPQCTDARDGVKRFYSFHFGNDMRPSVENLQVRRPFLTNELAAALSSQNETVKDYFTATDSYPKTFRIGTCSGESDTKVTLQILLFWRDDTKSEQKEVKVEALKNDDKWLINKVFN